MNQKTAERKTVSGLIIILPGLVGCDNTLTHTEQALTVRHLKKWGQ